MLLTSERTLALAEAFARALQELGGEAHLASGPEEARAVALTALTSRGVTEAVSWQSQALSDMGLPEAARGEGITWLEAAPDVEPAAYRAAAARAGAGITTAEYALAETGTMALLSGPGQPRSASLLPPVHIALVPMARLLPGLPELFRALGPRMAGGGAPSALNLITGPSRTADIEHILVRKVHGPGEVVVVLY